MAARRDRDGPTWAAAATGTGSPSPILRRSWASFPPPPRPETEPAFPPEALEPSPGKKQGGGGIKRQRLPPEISRRATDLGTSAWGESEARGFLWGSGVAEVGDGTGREEFWGAAGCLP
jgi:hypothetical protein